MAKRRSTTGGTVELEATWNKRPFIISGPCSAESETQVLTTATKLAATGKVDVFRAGVWKPRTKPGMFEGAGSKALKWMIKVREATGLPVIIETATAKQVNEALSAGIDMIWIGARTTVNPFSVQEIADALSGVQIPVFIKNPVNPDIELWCGAVERIAQAGIKKIGLIHRGFSSYADTNYRNPPMWRLAIEMKRRYPDLPLLNDPSHICGNRVLLYETMQQAIDFGFDGLMVESHYAPFKALTDSAQQVTPAVLNDMLSSLKWRKKNAHAGENKSALKKLRQSIDKLDNELLELLGRRMNIAQQIGIWKKENNISIVQTQRWQKSMQHAAKEGKALGLSEEFIFKYWDALHMESINHQKKIMDS